MTGNLKDLKKGCLGWIVIILLAFLLALCQAKCSEKDKEYKKADKKAQIEAPTTSYYCTDEELLEMWIEELEEDLASFVINDIGKFTWVKSIEISQTNKGWTNIHPSSVF